MSPLGAPTFDFQNPDLSLGSCVRQGSPVSCWDLEDLLLFTSCAVSLFLLSCGITCVAHALKWSQFTPGGILPVTSLTEKSPCFFNPLNIAML